MAKKKRGRPVVVRAHAEKTGASEGAAERLAVILETMRGELAVAEACERLCISEAQFHRLRDRALAGAAEALEPKKRGRPKKTAAEPTAEQVERLQQELHDTKVRLRAAQIREKISLLMPHLLVDEEERDEPPERGSLFPPKVYKP